MRRILAGCNEPLPIQLDTDHSELVFFSCPGDGEGSENEDAAGVWELDEATTVLALADGMGGCPGGGEAALLAIECLEKGLDRAAQGRSMRTVIVDAFENATENLRSAGQGAGTTLVVAEIRAGSVRTYHAGDSGGILVGQRGRVHHETIPHSPTGYAVAAGVLARDAVHEHEERHILSNCVGGADMRIELGPCIEMAARDTLMLASDGVLDNVRHQTIVDLIRKGGLVSAATELAETAQASIEGRGEVIGHPDDATALLFRKRPDRARR